LTPRDRFFSAQPFFHSGGLVQVMLTPIVLGTTVVVQRTFAAGDALAMMERERCTTLIGHQPHWIEYLNHPSLPTRSLALDKAFILATPEVNRMVRDAFGITLVCPYGLTETSLGGTGCDLDDPEDVRMTTVGKAHPGMEIQVRDPDTDAVLGAGRTGEILFRGWGVMKGYLNDPERTAAAIDADGWLRTGDAGELDEHGYLRLRNRIKDTIRVGGENVAAVEVEDLLLRHPAVKLAAVVGKPDLRLGEVCVAFVEPKAGARVTADELIDFCTEHIARFKVPREVRFIDAWPISGAGKIEKVKLRALVAAAEVPPMPPLVRVTVDRRGLATLELNRPDHGNALGTDVLAALIASLRAAEADPAIRIIALRGAGRHFCVGAEIPRSDASMEPRENDGASVASLLDVVAMLSKPIIAVVGGGCIGAGLALASACDVLLATDRAFFSLPELRLGIAPHAIVTSVVARAMGARHMRRYALTGERITVSDAFRIGLVHQHAADIEPALDALVDALLHAAPRATATLKAALREASPRTGDAHPGHAPSLADLLQSPEAIEGIASFREKRTPAWYPPPE
jgi:enoyl-CoA hydratase/carnithine racemase